MSKNQYAMLEQDYLVLAFDAPGSGPGMIKLAEVHWQFVDRYVSRLIARGPLISDDAQQHLGSVHILRGNAEEIRQFAYQEPYAQANFFADIAIYPYQNLLSQTMWQRADVAQSGYSCFLQAIWPAHDCPELAIADIAERCQADTAWIFLGLLRNPDQQCIGIAAAADLLQTEAVQKLRSVLEDLGLPDALIQTLRWRRGGRVQVSPP